MTRRILSFVAALAVACGVTLTAQMPDLRQMSGQPLPSAELPAGSVSVRVVRQTIANNVSDVTVQMAPAGGGAEVGNQKTDGSGRAIFAGLPIGQTLRATATVDGETLVSQPFTVPAAGGLRILLAAGLGAGAPSSSAPAAPAAPASPAAPGSVVLGGQSRIILELAEGSLEVFLLLDVVNPSGGAVTLPAPIVFEAPSAATNATLLEGSSPLAKVEGSHATIAGPLPAGTTSLQFAYRMPTPSASVAIRQALPLAASQLTVIVRKLNDLSVTLSNERGRRDAPIEGRTYLVLNGGAVTAGGTIDLTVDGLPAHAQWPRYVALGLALLVVIIGVWAIASGASPDDQDEARLRADRAARFAELVGVERRLVGKANPDQAQVDRRARLVAEIVELDLAIASTAPAGAPADADKKADAVRAAARASAAQ